MAQRYPAGNPSNPWELEEHSPTYQTPYGSRAQSYYPPSHGFETPRSPFNPLQSQMISPSRTSTPINQTATGFRAPIGHSFQTPPETDRRVRPSSISSPFRSLESRFDEALRLSYEKSRQSIDPNVSFGYSRIGGLDDSNPIDWPLTDSERQELRGIGIEFTGEDCGEMIGEGAFGEVWKCRKVMSNGVVKEMACKKVALKFYKIENKTLKRAQQLLINEMKAHQLANHSNVVKTEYVHHIYDRTSVYPHPITTLIFMDICDGDLAQLLRRIKPMKEAIAANWFHQMAQALAYLHTILIAHRDIKPANILFKIGPNGGYCFKLTDFGLVKIFETKDVIVSPVLLRSRSYLGSEGYMAPEIEGKTAEEDYDPFKADVFSIGVCLLHSMKTMFKSLVEKFSTNQIHLIERRVKGMSFQLKDLLLKMLISDPNRRLTMDEVCGHQWLQKYPYNPHFIDLEID